MEPEDRDNRVVSFLSPTDCISLPPPPQDDNGGDATAVGACVIDEPHLLRSPFAYDAAAAEETLPKRKRGRPRKAHVAGGRKTASKRVEEVCFVCYGGGDLLVCDRRWVCLVLVVHGVLPRAFRFLLLLQFCSLF